MKQPFSKTIMTTRTLNPAWFSIFGLGFLLAFTLSLGHEGSRVLQLWLLAVPPLLMLLPKWQPLASGRFTVPLLWSWSMLFVADGIVRGYFDSRYQAAPNSTMVIGAIANTSSREALEYFSMYWPQIALWLMLLAACGLVIWWLLRNPPALNVPNVSQRLTRWALVLLGVILLLSAIAYSSHPWRRWHPALFWNSWVTEVESLRSQWRELEVFREQRLEQAAGVVLNSADEEPSTVVLVLSESINRDNLSLYGYSRLTTPELEKRKQMLGDALVVIRNAWSVDASTLPALKSLFQFGSQDAQEDLHLLALARKSGYRIWWISNHDDMAIEQYHARFAHSIELLNRQPGRSSRALDESLLTPLQQALQDDAPKKLIVLHMMGAHPHYALRYAKGSPAFGQDGVEADLAKAGRSHWVRMMRNEYDTALRYHDGVVAKTLDLTRSAHIEDRYTAWVFLSDHGQEVGHAGNHAGHSSAAESGYKIPFVLWQSVPRNSYPKDIEGIPLRADWATWTLADLLALDWEGESVERNLLSPGYQWQRPNLPMPDGS